MQRRTSSDLHRGHRSRLKKRYIRENGEGFNDHELLELLLFYSLPRRNTNEIAHQLMERFGSVTKIASADMNELKQVDGIGDNTAVLFDLVLSLSKRILAEKGKNCERLPNLSSLVSYARRFLLGATGEQVYLVMMDETLRLVDTRLIAVGSVKEVKPLVRSVLELALLKRASAVALVHNHPNGGVEASCADVEFTTVLQRELEMVDIRFLEHLIVDSTSYNAISRSLREDNEADVDFTLDYKRCKR